MSGDELSEDLLSAYVDGELDAAERESVEARVASSSEWRAVLREVEETRALVRGLAPRAAPAGLWEGILAAADRPGGVDDDAEIATARPAAVAIGRGRRRGALALRIGAVAAAAAVVVAVLVVPTRGRTHPPVAALVNSHAARSSLTEDPVSQLAPVASPVRFGR